jgi:hypothetical protein
VRPTELWYATPNFPICTLYCNSLLGNLNSRNLNKSLGEVHNLGGSSLPLANITFAKVDIDVERCVVDDSKPVSASALPT